jgi:hypothetical protein
MKLGFNTTYNHVTLHLILDETIDLHFVGLNPVKLLSIKPNILIAPTNEIMTKLYFRTLWKLLHIKPRCNS